MNTLSTDHTIEPTLVTAAEHALEELHRREPVFHRPEFGTTRADFERMTDEAFWEIGASGRRYSREYVLDILEERGRNPIEDEWEVRDFDCAEIAADNYLVTYTLRQEERLTRRASIWRRTAAGWKIVFHQGTVVADSDPAPASSV
ncbi:DUF4440 domain-containing protein [Rudaea sp.]|uniref:nuclear transport factor 2 family protein n=1 Tax=Rudaea sp. TaxID=2136325 RepID=UPI002ED3A33B